MHAAVNDVGINVPLVLAIKGAVIEIDGVLVLDIVAARDGEVVQAECV